MNSQRLYIAALGLAFVVVTSAISFAYLLGTNSDLENQKHQLQAVTLSMKDTLANGAAVPTNFEPKEALIKLAQQYRVNSLDVEIGNKKLENFKDSEVLVEVTPVHLQFSAVHDSDILKFVAQVKEIFPGQILPRKLALSKKDEVDESTISQIKEGYKPDLVTGEFVFDWVDINQRGD